MGFVRNRVDAAVAGYGNGLGFFGNHHHDGIGFFRQAQRRTVAGAVALVDVQILGERQEAAGGMDAVLVDDDAAVVHG